VGAALLAGGTPMSFQPSFQQVDAMARIRRWFRHERHQRQVFRLFGYAGTGKTTITRHAIAELGLDTMDRDNGHGSVLYAAFTGKAALVMSRNGTPASTIHSLIYKIWEASPEEVAAAEHELAQLRAGLGAMGAAERAFAEAQIRQLERGLANLRRPRFVLNEQSLLHDADLLVLDEVSMVGADMAADLLAFGKPILVLGDPGQLPPIRGEGAFTNVAPDVLLSEVHRQSEDSAVLRLATMARKGEAIPFGEHDPYVWKMRREDVSPEQMLRGGQVICGRNATRRLLNAEIKMAAGFPNAYPEGLGEKIICLKNLSAVSTHGTVCGD
jgi:exodeoxyribonuclease-5